MAAVEVSNIPSEVVAQIQSIASVGIAVLLVYSLRRSLKDIASALGYGSDIERDAARARLAGEDVEVRDGAIYTRSAIDSMDAETAARSLGFTPADQGVEAPHDPTVFNPGDLTHAKLYHALVERGMDSESAIQAVEARNQAVEARRIIEKEDRKHDEFIAGGGDDMPEPVDTGPRTKFEVYEHQIAGGFSHDAAMRAADRWDLQQRQNDFEAKL